MQAWSEGTYGRTLIQMGWFPLLVLIVFGMVSIAFMVQMPKEKPRHNIKRVIRGIEPRYNQSTPEAKPNIPHENIVTKPRPLTPHPSVNKVFKHTKLKYTVENSVLINQTLTSLLHRVVLILDLLDVKYTIAHGTLIGWARGKQFVPWDDDIDIRVDYNDWSKLQNIYETAKKSQKNWNITTIYVNGSTVDIPLVQADERLSMLNERNDIQFRVLGIGYTKFNKKEKLTDDIHLDLVSSVSVAGGFWMDVRSAFRSEFIHSTMNGVNVTVTPHYNELLSRQYGNWRVPR